MSIKIHNAVRWTNDDPFEVGRSVHATITGTRRRLLYRFCAGLAVAATSERIANNEPLAQLGILDTENKLRSIIVDAENGARRHPLDLSCEVSLLRHPTEPEFLYGVVYAERPEFLDAVIRSGAREFEFWNNTDPPSDIGASWWAERGRIWSEILDGFRSTPAEVGLSVRVDHRSVGTWLPLDFRSDPLLAEIVATEIARFAAEINPAQPIPTVAQVISGGLTEHT